MSTNYYFELKQEKIEELKKKINNLKHDLRFQFPFIYSIECVKVEIDDVENFKNIHIGKLSCGWKPLFAKTKFYDSIKSLQDFYLNYKEYFNIVTEYGVILNWNQLEDEFINCNKEKMSHLIWHGENVCGDKNIYNMFREYYYVDNNGYEWCENDFC